MPNALLEEPIEHLRFIDDEEEEEMRDFPMREDLCYSARKQAEQLRSIARGIMLITGEPGGGKDLFAVSTAALMKYIFGRKVILDFMPKRAFGAYTLFDAPTIIRKIQELAKTYHVEGVEDSEDKKEATQFMEEATIKWLLEGEGWDIFKGAVYYVSEGKKVVFNRNPNARTNKFFGSLGTVYRHLDLLNMVTHVHENELDVKAFLQYAKLRTVCVQTWEQDVIRARIVRGAYSGPDFVLSNTRGMIKPLTFYVNGAAPRDFLGGKRFYDLYATKHMHF